MDLLFFEVFVRSVYRKTTRDGEGEKPDNISIILCKLFHPRRGADKGSQTGGMGQFCVCEYLEPGRRLEGGLVVVIGAGVASTV